MSLVEKITQDYTAAMKERQMQKVNVLRLVMSALKNEAIKTGGIGTVLTDEQALAVLTREVKQRRDASAQYSAANRPELAAQEETEITIISTYLPEAMDDDALAALVNTILTETGATSKTDMGKVMAALKSKLTNPADLGRAASLVNQKLS